MNTVRILTCHISNIVAVDLTLHFHVKRKSINVGVAEKPLNLQNFALISYILTTLGYLELFFG
jgi:hypothetical protein